MNNLQAIHICLPHNILIDPERSIFITRENVIGLPYTHIKSCTLPSEQPLGKEVRHTRG